MRLSSRTRIALYVAALALAVAAVITVGVITARKRGFWWGELRRWEKESSSAAGEARGAFQDLNLKLLRFEISRKPEDKAQFEEAAAALTRWFEERGREDALPETRKALRELSADYALYLGQTEKLLAGLPSEAAPDLPATIEAHARRLLRLDAVTRGRQREALLSLGGQARADLDWLWNVLFSGLAILLLCLLALAWVVYRDLIAPLRRTVAHSRMLLERREKLSALGLVAAGLAHEIRNPLNSIKARLFIQRRLLGAGSPGLEDNQFIDEEIDRLEGIVKTALHFGRPSEPAFQRQRVQTLLEPVCELLPPALAKAAIALRTDFRADPLIRADSDQIKQVLLNLVNNAADSIGRDGTITLRTRPAFLRRHRRRVAAVAIEVQDTGRGILPEARARLFDPFFTTKENGTGLGLSITARIVDAHEGVVECENPPEGGALFRILLPIIQT